MINGLIMTYKVMTVDRSSHIRGLSLHGNRHEGIFRDTPYLMKKRKKKCLEYRYKFKVFFVCSLKLLLKNSAMRKKKQ